MTNRFKDALRKTYLQVRKKLPDNFQEECSKIICFRIKTLRKYRAAIHIGYYYAANGEASINTLWRSAPAQGKYCYFPTLTKDKTLQFLPATTETNFKPNRFGILEPDVDQTKAIHEKQLDIVFVPLTAFDIEGKRIGMGAGYYDKTFATKRPKLLIGVAYEFQGLPFISTEAWDIPLDAIVTEEQIYWT